ncbi:MAG: HAD-IA family hydrolase, partial [Acholeplasmataceae bacterium]
CSSDLFDFDGTIADTMSMTYHIYEKMAQKYGMPVLSREVIQAYKKLPLQERLNKQGIPFYMVPKLLSESQVLQKEFKDEAIPFEGMIDVLNELSETFKLIIISSNHKKFIKYFLKSYDISFFDKVFGKAALFGKASVIKKALKKLGYKKSEAIYVGDETRDIMACRELGIDLISVSWGYDDISLLEKEEASMIAKTPNDIKSFVQSLY